MKRQSGLDWQHRVFHRGRCPTLAAYKSYIDLGVSKFVLVDSRFDFISAPYAAKVNNTGSMGTYKKIFRLIQNIKVACLKLN